MRSIKQILREELENVAKETMIDKFGDERILEKNDFGWNLPKDSYKTDVKEKFVDILMHDLGISEKDFSKIDDVVSKTREFFNSPHKEKIDELIKNCEKSKIRKEYCAEKIYNEYYKQHTIKTSLNEAKKTEFQKLKDNKVPLSDGERNEVMKSKAVWHRGKNGEATPAVWKSKNEKTGKITYISNTHRLYQTATTLEAAINKYHRYVKQTA